MNVNTGVIRGIKELLDQNENIKENWFGIDRHPDENCKTCEGHGFVGYFANSKVIPCTCIFDSDLHWGIAVIKQRDLPKTSRDHGLDAMHKF